MHISTSTTRATHRACTRYNLDLAHLTTYNFDVILIFRKYPETFDELGGEFLCNEIIGREFAAFAMGSLLQCFRSDLFLVLLLLVISFQ